MTEPTPDTPLDQRLAECREAILVFMSGRGFAPSAVHLMLLQTITDIMVMSVPPEERTVEGVTARLKELFAGYVDWLGTPGMFHIGTAGDVKTPPLAPGVTAH